jgi:4-amino-4-deoxy-L-arabinose transferase-like glycosyltransferase
MVADLITGLTMLVAVPLFFVLPGYVTFIVFSSSSKRAEQHLDLAEGFQLLLFSVLWTGWLAVLLAQWGRFSIVTLLWGNLLYSLVLALWGWRRGVSWRIPRWRLRRADLLLLGIMTLAAVLFTHPHEFVLGGADAGVYVNLGANIVRTGSWLIHDPVIAAVDPVLYPGLFREQPAYAIPQYIQYPGFYLTAPASGNITPQFYPLHPVWLAIFYGLGGLKFSLFATPLWGILGCVAVYFTAKSLFGRRTALLAAGLLTLTATQIWFSRYPTSEVLAQFLLFGGLYAFVLYLEERSLWAGLLAGFALGGVTLVRLDLYFIVAIPLGYGVYDWLKGRVRRDFLAFLIPFLLQMGYSLAFAWLQTWPYFYNVYGSMLQRVIHVWPLWLSIGLVVGGGLIGGFSWLRLHPRRLARLEVGWAWAVKALAVAVVLLALYAYFLRPSLADPNVFGYYWYGGNRIPNVEPYNFVRLGWYLSPLGLALGVLGTWWVLRRDMNARTALLVGVGLFFSILFLHRTHNNPHHIYVMRRYVPVVIPFFMIMSAYALNVCLRYADWRRWLGQGLSVVLALWLLYAARIVIPHVEFQGLLSQFENAVQILGEKPAVILFDDDRPVGLGVSVGTPLRYLYGYSVFDLQEDRMDMSALQEQIKRWQSEGQRILLASDDHSVHGFFGDMPCTPLSVPTMTAPVLEASYKHFPRQIYQYTIALQFCELPPLP